jgi:hypothetical protein
MLARTLPKRIENDAEFDRFVETMEALSRAIERGEASHEEQALHSLLSTPIREYDGAANHCRPQTRCTRSSSSWSNGRCAQLI